MSTGIGGEDDYSLLEAAAAIVEGLGFGQPEPSFRDIQTRIQYLITGLAGEHLEHADVQAHGMPDGTIVYSASRMCSNCAQIHTLLFTVEQDGTLKFSAPLPEGE